jgi:hypothetical protein
MLNMYAPPPDARDHHKAKEQAAPLRHLSDSRTPHEPWLRPPRRVRDRGIPHRYASEPSEPLANADRMVTTTALPVDQIAPAAPTHACSEALFSCSLDLAVTSWVVHFLSHAAGLESTPPPEPVTRFAQAHACSLPPEPSGYNPVRRPAPQMWACLSRSRTLSGSVAAQLMGRAPCPSRRRGHVFSHSRGMAALRLAMAPNPSASINARATEHWGRAPG